MKKGKAMAEERFKEKFEKVMPYIRVGFKLAGWLLCAIILIYMLIAPFAEMFGYEMPIDFSRFGFIRWLYDIPK